MLIYLIIIILPIILLRTIYYIYWDFDFWKGRNVKGPKPRPFFGNYADVILGKTHQSELTKSCYDGFKDEKMVGVYALNSPVLILRDLNLIKDVLIKDSSVFADRGIHVFETVEPLSQHLFNLPHSSWQPLRSNLNSAFAGNKEMLAVTQDIANKLVCLVEREALKEGPLECFSLFGKCTTEVIGGYAFGLTLHQLGEEATEFQEVCKSRQLPNFFNFARRFLREHLPRIYKHIGGIFIRNDEVTKYYTRMMQDIETFREIHDSGRRKDFVGNLLDLKNNQDRKLGFAISNKFLAAQAYVIFTAGADTSSVIISNGLCELSMNENIQEKLRDEIRKIIKSNEQTFTLYDLKKIKYLDNVYKEILRKYPIRDIIRRNNETYTFRGTNVTIPKNTKIVIPHYGIQRDFNYYPNPEIFNPDRFNNEEYKNSMAYLPFGDGPHYCIGNKWAETIIKVIIVKIILNFDITIDKEDIKKINNYDPRKVFLWPKGGIYLKFHNRKAV